MNGGDPKKKRGDEFSLGVELGDRLHKVDGGVFNDWGDGSVVWISATHTDDEVAGFSRDDVLARQHRLSKWGSRFLPVQGKKSEQAEENEDGEGGVDNSEWRMENSE